MNKPRSNIGKMTPLSFPQRRIWFLQHLYQDDVMYTVNKCFHIQGSLDVEALKVTLQTLALRHEPLRTRFRITPDGLPCQLIEDLPEIRIDYTDLYERPEADRRALAGQVIQEAAVRPFKLCDELMVRLELVRLNPSETILLFVQHHIITDNSSWRLLLAEFTAVYTALVKGMSPSLPPLPWQYSDFAEKQAQLLTRDAISKKQEYWRDFFAGYTWPEQATRTLTEPPTKGVPPSYDTTWLHIPADTVSNCIKIAEGQKCTLFIVVLTAIALLVRFLYGPPQVLLCLASANRQLPGAEDVVGCFFTNIIVSLNILNGQKLDELIQDVKATFATARRQQDMPFEMFAEDLGLACTRQCRPPYRIYISYRHSADEVPFSLPDAHLTPMVVSTGRNTHEDMVFNFWERHSDGGLCLELAWLCRSDVFDHNSMEKLTIMLESLVANLNEGLAQNVGKLYDTITGSGSLYSLP